VKAFKCNIADSFTKFNLIVFWQTEAHVMLLCCTRLTKNRFTFAVISVKLCQWGVENLCEVNLRYDSSPGLQFRHCFVRVV